MILMDFPFTLSLTNASDTEWVHRPKMAVLLNFTETRLGEKFTFHTTRP